MTYLSSSVHVNWIPLALNSDSRYATEPTPQVSLVMKKIQNSITKCPVSLNDIVKGMIFADMVFV